MYVCPYVCKGSVTVCAIIKANRRKTVNEKTLVEIHTYQSYKN